VMTPTWAPSEGLHGWVRRHPVIAFVVLAYTLSWLTWLPALLGIGGTALIILGGLGPLVAAWVVTRYTGSSIRAQDRVTEHKPQHLGIAPSGRKRRLVDQPHLIAFRSGHDSLLQCLTARSCSAHPGRLPARPGGRARTSGTDAAGATRTGASRGSPGTHVSAWMA
jgi:hypothetical protein